MTKVFALFGILCVYDPMDGKRCMNFWEEPVVRYTIEQCADRAKEKGKEINDLFQKKGMDVLSLEVYCLPIDKHKKT